jgi:murein L,D-transpeptidase YcbB/YkuD
LLFFANEPAKRSIHMVRRLILGIGVSLVVFAVAEPLLAEEAAKIESTAPAPQASPPSKAADGPEAKAAMPLAPEAEALRKALAALAARDSDEERNEHANLLSFYEARAYAPLWLTGTGEPTPKAALAAAEIGRADEWGLKPKDFPLPPRLSPRGAEGTAKAASGPETAAADEIAMSFAVLKYGRYARGGQIVNPAEQLSSYLDRRPQLVKPQIILDGIAAADAPDAYLRGLHPAHPQFEKLRQKYFSLLGQKKQKSAEAKKLLANMEEWRWMPADMGDIYVWNNIPDFTQRVIQDGKTVREVRIVAGLIDKQTPIFSRPMRKIVFKPTWIVPDSIKVRELWPSLLNGGGLLREWALEVRTKDGQSLNWRKIDWSTADIREYEVIQPNGPKSVMGKVKFSFPNQHTVFMHDTLPRDKWMFNASRRTYSHGCMRVADPIGLAKIILRADKGWDPARVIEAANTGPLNNEIALEHKIMVHMTYFTAFVDDDGKLHTFPDVYGHERRISLALEGKWDRIVKGRDHLAPVELDLSDAPRRRPAEDEASDLPAWRQRNAGVSRGILDSIFGNDDR